MKGNFSKIIKNLLRSHKRGEAETWHACLGHQPLYKLCFHIGRIRTLVAMATYIFHRLIQSERSGRKSGYCIFLCSLAPDEIVLKSRKKTWPPFF